MSAFDDIDRRFRASKTPEIKLDPPEEGNCCPDPRCGGSLRVRTFGAAEGTCMQLACDGCEQRFGETCP